MAQQVAGRGVIEGVVVDGADSSGVGGVHVRVLGTAFATVSRRDGTFRFAEVPAGSYRITTVATGFEPRTIENVVVTAATITRLNIRLRRSALMQDAPVVTAGRRLQSIKETSMSTTVVPAAELRRIGASSLEAAVTRIPGVDISGTQPSMRGSDGCSLLAGGRVGLMLDGLPYLAPDDGRIPLGLLPLAAAERIELSRGALSALHGSGAVGGTVNIITRDPAEEPQGFVRGYTGFYTAPGVESWGWSGGRIQRFSGVEGLLTRRSGNLGVLVSGSYHHDDSYRQSDGNDRYDIFGRIGWTLTPRLQLRVGMARAEVQQQGWSGWRSADSALFAAEVSADSIDADRVRGNTAVFGEITAHASESFSLIVRGIYQKILQEYDTDGELPAITLMGAARYFGEAQMISYLNQRLLFTYGGSLAFDAGDATTLDGRVLRSTSLYAQMEFGNTRDITTTVGGRLDMLLAPGVEVPNELQLSPRVGVAYRPFKETALRISIGRGFRAPSLVERYADVVVQGLRIRPNPQLRPEQSWQGEIGVTHEITLPFMSLTADAALYMNEYFSMIEPVLVGTTRDVVYDNVARARILGADVMLRARMRDMPLVATVALARMSARDLRMNTALACRSDFTLNLSLHYTTGPFGISLDYHIRSAPEEVGDIMLAAYNDADYQHAEGIIDAVARLDLEPVMNLPASATLTARNLLQSYATQGVASVVPLRSFEVGLEGRF